MILKHCTGCTTDKPLTDFAWKNRVEERLQSRCRACQSAAQSSWYQKNSSSHKASVARYNLQLRKQKRDLVQEIKTSTPCSDCGDFYHFAAMDFDHLSEKKFNIATIVNSAHTMKALLLEIEKCELVCSNCHRVRTWDRSQIVP